MSRIVVIGGGVAGLACARGLADRLPEAELHVLEAGERAGGHVRTLRVDGFTFEAGPVGWLNRDPSTLALAVRLGLGDELLTACEQARRRFVLHRGRLAPFPDGPASFLSTPLLSLPARLRMMLEPLVPRARGRREETVAQFAKRRLGRGAAANLVEPVVYGIYAGDPHRLGLRETLPQLAQVEASGRSLLSAYLKARHEAAPPGEGLTPATIGRRRLVSFREGSQVLVDTLADSLGPALRLRSPVSAVRSEGRRFRVVVAGDRGEDLLADAVVCAAPAAAAASFLADLDPDLAAACAGVPYSPVAVVAFGYREADVPHPLDGFGFLMAGRELGSVLGVHWSSSMFPGQRSPRGHVTIQAVLGGVRDPVICERDDDEIVERALEQVERALGVSSAPVRVRIFRHPRGLPQYVLGHGRRRELAERAAVRRPGLFLTGSSWRGIGMNACTADAERVTDAVAALLGAQEPRAVEGAPARTETGAAGS